LSFIDIVRSKGWVKKIAMKGMRKIKEKGKDIVNILPFLIHNCDELSLIKADAIDLS
jgi:hypothetical protein